MTDVAIGVRDVAVVRPLSLHKTCPRNDDDDDFLHSLLTAIGNK